MFSTTVVCPHITRVHTLRRYNILTLCYYGICLNPQRKGRGGIKGIYTMKTSRAVERIKKKLQEQQVSYWMAVPSLPLRLYADNGKVRWDRDACSYTRLYT